MRLVARPSTTGKKAISVIVDRVINSEILVLVVGIDYLNLHYIYKVKGLGESFYFEYS
jgi:hypothetical protein